MPTISITLATYNGQRFLRQQLDSLAAQYRLPDELVISDDASTDDTVAIAESFAATAPFPVRIFRHADRLGYRANFMRAAHYATSDLIAFCDQDDVWYSRKLLYCVEPFNDPAVLLTHHAIEVVTETGRWLASPSRFAPASTSSPGSLCSIRRATPAFGFTEVFHRSILSFSDLWPRSLDYNDPAFPMAHDQWVFFIASVFGRVVYLDRPLAAYRQHGANLFGFGTIRDPFKSRRVPANPADSLYALRRSADRCAEILELCSRLPLPKETVDRATLGAARYRRLADLYAARSRLYTATSLPERLRAFYRIVSSRGYQPKWSFGLGPRALLRDLCLGIPGR